MIHIAGDHAGHTCTSLIRVGPEQLALPHLHSGSRATGSPPRSRYRTGQYETVLEWLKIMKPLGGSRAPADNQGHDLNPGWMPTIFWQR
ncbi:hypothetical protein C0J52_19261 [Blattella germanica]|nr:hypothetical protein C0J52_19261 [Blattella germanica]